MFEEYGNRGSFWQGYLERKALIPESCPAETRGVNHGLRPYPAKKRTASLCRDCLEGKPDGEAPPYSDRPAHLRPVETNKSILRPDPTRPV